MTVITIPSPTTLFGARKAPTMPAPPKPRLVAPIVLDEPGDTVRPGLVPQVVESIHDGVVKAKHLRRGQRVRPYVLDRATGKRSPLGSERIIDSVKRLDGGANVLITFASAHSPETRPASYRWHDASLAGTTKQTVVQKPGFVTYSEA